MAYIKKVWVDDVTPISAANMNNIENILDGLGNVTAEIATQAEAQAGVVNNKYVTPLRAAEAITALGAKSVGGYYTGDGAATRTINIGFTPVAVIVMEKGYLLYDNPTHRGGMAVTGKPTASNSVTITTNGFIVAVGTTYTNSSGIVYNYLAIK